jgi:hypothetical protein
VLMIMDGLNFSATLIQPSHKLFIVQSSFFWGVLVDSELVST